MTRDDRPTTNRDCDPTRGDVATRGMRSSERANSRSSETANARAALRARRNDSRRRTANILVTTAVLMVVLLGLMALAIDVGTMTQVRTQLQRSADAAALAGASKLHDQNAATAVVAEATRYVSMNSVAGTSIALDPVDVEIGIWNPGDRSFTPRSSSLGNAVRVTPRTREGTLFFGRIFTSEPPEIRASAIAATRPREIAFVIDLSGSMNDDTEPCWATDEIALRWGAGPANRLMENLYSDLGLGTFPGAVQWVGQGTGVLTDEWAYAELTDNQGPLTRIVDRYYRILSTDTEAERKTKAYRWIIDSQIAAVMPKAGPVADSRQNFEFWSKYLDYVIGPVWVADSGDPNNGGGGVTPRARIILLIQTTQADREAHRRAGRQIEALACAIPIKALEDALRALAGPVDSPSY